MICPSCSRNHKKKDGTTCLCGYHFKLEKIRDGLTDNNFANLVEATSGGGTYYFTQNQLESRYLRRATKKRHSVGWTISWVLAAVVAAALGALEIAFVTGVVALISAGKLLTSRSNYTVALNSSPIPRAVARFKGDGKTLGRMLTAPSLGQPPPDFAEADIYAYGTERILIVESDLLVDLFVKNDFHAHQRVLIVGESGYPNYLEDIANKIIEEHPHTPVFLLHHANSGPNSMRDRLAQSGRLPALAARGEDQVLDLGFTTTDAQRLFPALDAEFSATCRIDSLPYPALSNLVSLAMSEYKPFSQLPAEEVKRFDDNGSFG